MQRNQTGLLRLLAGVTVIVVLLGTVASIGGLFGGSGSNAEGFPSYPVHWHFPLNITVCGQEYAFTQEEEHGNIIHGHNDGLIHIEGKVTDPNAVTIGKFFESIGLDFGNDHIAEYKSGETTCPDAVQPGMLTVKANNTLLDDPVNYILDREHQDITATFE